MSAGLTQTILGGLIMSTATIRAPQRVANALFHHLSSWRSLIGLVTIAVLTVISITFNYQLGLLMGSDSITKQLFPVGFAVLDLAALFLASWITIKSRSWLRKGMAWVWFSYLLILSVWAAMAFTLASDARLSQSGYEMMKDAKVRALEQAEEQVELAQSNYAETTRYKRLRMGELREAQDIRDGLIKDVQRLNNENPHVSLAIYYRVSALLHHHYDIDIDPKDLSSVVRMLWALALTLSPFILTGLLAFEIGSTPPRSRQPIPTDNEISDFAPRKTERWGEPSPNFKTVAEKAEFPHEQRGVEEVDRIALTKVREWLRSQEGRVSRRQIEHKAGTRKYAQVSLIIDQLLKEGWLNRMGLNE
jgi:hypothetical protein